MNTHHYIPESFQQSKQWTKAGSSEPKRPQATNKSAAKVSTTVFWDARRIILRDYLQPSQKSTTGRY